MKSNTSICGSNENRGDPPLEIRHDDVATEEFRSNPGGTKEAQSSLLQFVLTSGNKARLKEGRNHSPLHIDRSALLRKLIALEINRSTRPRAAKCLRRSRPFGGCRDISATTNRHLSWIYSTRRMINAPKFPFATIIRNKKFRPNNIVPKGKRKSPRKRRKNLV